MGFGGVRYSLGLHFEDYSLQQLRRRRVTSGDAPVSTIHSLLLRAILSYLLPLRLLLSPFCSRVNLYCMIILNFNKI